MKINLNGVEREIEGDQVTYESIAKACGRSPEPGLTITYSMGRCGGTILPGHQSMTVEDGAIINCVNTGRA